jgi:hypothetical protein
VVAGWLLMAGLFCWLVADKPNEQDDELWVQTLLAPN